MANDSQKPARHMTERQARRALNDARIGLMHSAYWTAELVDRLGWRALGFDTAEAFADVEMGLSRSTLWRILDQGRMIRRLSGGNLRRLGSYAISQRLAGELKKVPDDLLDEAGERIAGGEEPSEVLAATLDLLKSLPKDEGMSRDPRHGKGSDQQEHEEGDAQTGTKMGEGPAAPQPEDGAEGEAPAGTSDGEEDPSPQPDPSPGPPSPPDPPGNGSTEDDEQARLATVREENKAVGDLIHTLLPLEPSVLSRVAKRSELVDLEGLAKRAQQADPDNDGSRVVLLAADLVARFLALPSEPFDAGVNRAIRDLLAEVDRLRQPGPVQPAPAPPAPPAATKVKPAATAKKAPKPAAVKRPKKGEPCPHPRQAHVGVDMRGVTCSWCDAKALTHVSLERMGQQAVAAR